VVSLLGLRLAAKAVELMEQDEDDLFFEHGRTRTEFLDALVRGERGGRGRGDVSSLTVVFRAWTTSANWIPKV
jgi:hypothetical protein